MLRRSRALFDIAWPALALVIAGCSGAKTEKLSPVAGKVTVDGAPLTTGGVTFHPDAAKGVCNVPDGAVQPTACLERHDILP